MMLLPECRVCGGKGSLVVGVEGLECLVKKVGLYSGAVMSRGRDLNTSATRSQWEECRGWIVVSASGDREAGKLL